MTRDPSIFRQVIYLLCILAWILALLYAPRPARADDFPSQVAARCKGEAPYAIGECACTVQNRLLRGWTQSTVLDAYYAPDASPSAAESAHVANVLAGDCDPRLYFMWSRSDTQILRIDCHMPILEISTLTSGVRFYSYEQYSLVGTC